MDDDTETRQFRALTSWFMQRILLVGFLPERLHKTATDRTSRSLFSGFHAAFISERSSVHSRVANPKNPEAPSGPVETSKRRI